MNTSVRRAPVLERDEYLVAAAFGVAGLLLHLLTNGIWGFHRDELLYLAMGGHLDWGYWSNPPLIGFFGWLIGFVPDPEPWIVRLIPALLGAALVTLTGLLARELGGGRRSVAMACFGMLLSPAFLRVGVLFQPVIFDVLCWTVCAYFIVRFVNEERFVWLWALGAAIGVGMLNKYSIAFLVLGALIALPFTPHRRLFVDRRFYGAIGLAFVIVLPNLVWQAVHGFPVIQHMQDLQATQLAFVRPQDFLFEQLLIHLPVVFLWILGLIALISGRFRLLALIFFAVMALLLLMGGKSYYTLGLYPPLFAAGAVWLEMRARPIVQAALFFTASILSVAISPFALPYLPVESMIAYSAGFLEVTGVDAPLRWEDGRSHPLPQDYADMLGWPELAGLIDEAYRSQDDSAGVLIYCENYGQAGAAIRFLNDRIPEPVSFSDSYLLWAPRRLSPDVNTLIYVNDEMGEDVAGLFEDIRLQGTVSTPFARERGTKVWVCRNPRRPLHAFWAERVASLYQMPGPAD